LRGEGPKPGAKPRAGGLEEPKIFWKVREKEYIFRAFTVAFAVTSLKIVELLGMVEAMRVVGKPPPK